jgi:hypothetical protein
MEVEMTPQLMQLIAAAQQFANSSTSSSLAAKQRAGIARGINLCLRAAAVKELASTLSSPLQGEVIAQADNSIANIIDDFCGTMVPFVPHPWPGPSPAALELATQLTIGANTIVQSQAMRIELLRISKTLIEKAYDK